MDKEEFKEKVYEPYLESWKIIKLIQYADQTADYDAQWQRYLHEINRLNSQYKDNRFVDKLIIMLIDAGDAIAKMNNKRDEA